MPKFKDLLKAWKESDERLDRLIAKMEPTLQGRRKELVKLIKALPVGADGTISSGVKASTILNKLGLDTEITKALGKLFPQAINSAGPLLDAVDLEVPDVSRRAQLTFANKADGLVKKVTGSLNKGLSGLLQQAASTPIPADKLAKLASSLADQPIAQARTVANTTLSGLQRETASQAAAGLPGKKKDVYWIYAGPSGGPIRPFCEVLVGKAIPQPLMSKLNNGQGLSVKSFQGGYNCRHSLVPVSKAFVDAANVPKANAATVGKANGAAKK